MNHRILALALCLLLLPFAAFAQEGWLEIPASVTEIQADAFKGVKGASHILVPNGVNSIGEKAFADMTGLQRVSLPATVSEIADSAFQGDGPISVTAPKGSYACQWALDRGYLGYTTSLMEDDTLMVARFDADAEHVSVPGAINSIPVTVIGEGAFAGLTALTSVVIPSSVTAVGSEAFSGCPNLQSITIPDSVTSIGSAQDASAILSNGHAPLVRCAPDSEAMRYAADHNLDYNADTTYRALLIGITYPDTGSTELPGPDNDVAALHSMLDRMSGCDYQVTEELNPTKAELLNLIDSTFQGAKAQDISLLYYSGHGSSYGDLIGSDMQAISPSALRTAMDAIPGRKILIIDSCYSGALIADDDITALTAPQQSEESEPGHPEGEPAAVPRSDEAAEDTFCDNFIAAFSPMRIKRSAFNPSSYFVLAASRYDQESISITFDEHQYYGLFSMSLCLGCGWNETKSVSAHLSADTDSNGVVSIGEVRDYIEKYTKQSYSLWQWAEATRQQVQAYPADCYWFSPFRT